MAGSEAASWPGRHERGVAAMFGTVMSPFMLASVVIFFLMAQRLADMYVGGKYTCPSCGAKRADRHSSDCPWGRLPGE